MNEFDVKASGWDQNRMHRERAEAVARELLAQIPVDNRMSALEYGAGTALTSFQLINSLGMITAMDSSPEMVKITKEKIRETETKNMNALLFDLEKHDWTGENFDLVIIQMTLHHISDTAKILKKFHGMLNPGGYIAIADLYPEDGSFHNHTPEVHNGFDPSLLSDLLASTGFSDIKHQKCFTIKKTLQDDTTGEFDMFLLSAYRQ